jgi:NAD+ kinase
VSTVGLFVHPGRADALALAATVRTWLADRGHQVIEGPDDDGARLDLVIAIGGDGTVLRSARRAAATDADVLGINLGELGYLAEVERDAWEEALTAYFGGQHRTEERLLVQARLGDGTLLPPALNEVVIEKQALGRTIRMAVAIDGGYFTSYVADGLIVATPTGSTAYSLSARGPIVDPSHRALIMTAVSPHSLFDRSLVLGPSSVVEVTVKGDRDAAISIDGQQHGLIAVGETLTISAAPEPARFATFGGRDFHQILKAKFGLSDR